MEVPAILLAGLVVLDVWATVLVVGDYELERRRKALQLVLIWAVPLLGAVLCLVVAYVRRRAYRKRSEEFVDSGGCGGGGDGD